MTDNTVSCGLVWDLVVSQSVDQSQRWVLTTMQRHGGELVTMLWRILGNEQDVCDAYQSTFLRLAHCEAGKRPKHTKAYVFRTASNVAVSMLRRKMAERNRLAAAADAGTTTVKVQDTGNPRGNEASVDGDLHTKDLQDNLRLCIARLPEHLRNVVTLRDLAELPYRQVGKVLGISAATARVYRCKAIRLLALWMNREKRREQ